MAFFVEEMTIYGEESSRHSSFGLTKMSPKQPIFLILYFCLFFVLLSLCLMGILVPVWLGEIDDLEKTQSEEFAAIRVSLQLQIFSLIFQVKSEAAWRQLLQIESDDNSVAWARIRRKTNEEYNVYDYRRPDDNFANEAVYDGSKVEGNPSEYLATPLFSQDGYDQPRCCCNLDSYRLSDLDALTVSWKCPVGRKGPPGQTG